MVVAFVAVVFAVVVAVVTVTVAVIVVTVPIVAFVKFVPFVGSVRFVVGWWVGLREGRVRRVRRAGRPCVCAGPFVVGSLYVLRVN